MFAPSPPPLPPGFYFDSYTGTVLPNGTALSSVDRRIRAFVLSVVLFIATLAIGYVIWSVIVWDRGLTPAFQVMRMRAWRPSDGLVAGWGTMALRQIVGHVADHILGPITWVISLVMLTGTRQRRALNDFIAGTVVLDDPDKVLR